MATPVPPATEEGRRDGSGHAPSPHGKRVLHEAAHKLRHRGPIEPAVADRRSEEVKRRFDALEEPDRDVIVQAGRAVLALGALGVVYGDIGTSPLYTEQVIFTSHRAAAAAN